MQCPGCWPGSSLLLHTGASDSTASSPSRLSFQCYTTFLRFCWLTCSTSFTLHHSLSSRTGDCAEHCINRQSSSREFTFFLAQATCSGVLRSLATLITASSSTCPSWTRVSGWTFYARPSLCTASVFLTFPLLLWQIVSTLRILNYNGYQSLSLIGTQPLTPGCPITNTPPSPQLYLPYRQITSFIFLRYFFRHILTRSPLSIRSCSSCGCIISNQLFATLTQRVLTVVRVSRA